MNATAVKDYMHNKLYFVEILLVQKGRTRSVFEGLRVTYQIK